MLKKIARKTARKIRALVMKGGECHCPVCNNNYARWVDGQVCPGCRSYERHRLLWLYLLHLERISRIDLRGKLLHVAPEVCLAKNFKRRFDYLSIDRDSRHAMQAADIMKLPFADSSFDAVICNHVLEHVDDDRKAMSELQRVLKPGGWASLLVPMRGDAPTDEDPSVVDPQERLKRFGQEDHVRLYGHDYPQRLRESGFTVESVSWADFLGRETAERCQTLRELIIIGWKLPAAAPALTEASPAMGAA